MKPMKWTDADEQGLQDLRSLKHFLVAARELIRRPRGLCIAILAEAEMQVDRELFALKMRRSEHHDAEQRKLHHGRA